jgi:hypothetical protein
LAFCDDVTISIAKCGFVRDRCITIGGVLVKGVDEPTYVVVANLIEELSKCHAVSEAPKVHCPALDSDIAVVGMISVAGTACKNYSAVALDI